MVEGRQLRTSADPRPSPTSSSADGDRPVGRKRSPARPEAMVSGLLRAIISAHHFFEARPTDAVINTAPNTEATAGPCIRVVTATFTSLDRAPDPLLIGRADSIPGPGPVHSDNGTSGILYHAVGGLMAPPSNHGAHPLVCWCDGASRSAAGEKTPWVENAKARSWKGVYPGRSAVLHRAEEFIITTGPDQGRGLLSPWPTASSWRS